MAFINVPVADNEASKSSYSAFESIPSPQFESQTTAGLLVEENIFDSGEWQRRWTAAYRNPTRRTTHP